MWRRRVEPIDEIRVRVVEAETVDRPKTRDRRNPKAELAEQKRYVRKMARQFGWQIVTKAAKKEKR